jgi:hypothetical protein
MKLKVVVGIEFFSAAICVLPSSSRGASLAPLLEGGCLCLPSLTDGEARGPRRSERARGGTGVSRRAQPEGESRRDLARPRSAVGSGPLPATLAGPEGRRTVRGESLGPERRIRDPVPEWISARDAGSNQEGALCREGDFRGMEFLKRGRSRGSRRWGSRRCRTPKRATPQRMHDAGS